MRKRVGTVLQRALVLYLTTRSNLRLKILSHQSVCTVIWQLWKHPILNFSHKFTSKQILTRHIPPVCSHLFMETLNDSVKLLTYSKNLKHLRKCHFVHMVVRLFYVQERYVSHFFISSQRCLAAKSCYTKFVILLKPHIAPLLHHSSIVYQTF